MWSKMGCVRLAAPVRIFELMVFGSGYPKGVTSTDRRDGFRVSTKILIRGLNSRRFPLEAREPLWAHHSAQTLNSCKVSIGGHDLDYEPLPVTHGTEIKDCSFTRFGFDILEAKFGDNGLCLVACDR
jgi:hypothetical protein